MAKKAFAFALGQRVNVPGKRNVQGVVSLPRATQVIEFCNASGNPDLFFVRWLQDNGLPACGWFGEPGLTATNLPPAEDVPVFIVEPVKRKPARRRKSRR